MFAGEVANELQAEYPQFKMVSENMMKRVTGDEKLDPNTLDSSDEEALAGGGGADGGLPDSSEDELILPRHR